ncbi:adenylyl cyclase-associated family protein [Phanerochaete sordida]|uniref:Adenylyl cyclase-associated protein n=1 Tax=Phanerochaete sordida TaxID=48140 RepID=A0A9P3GMH8_9APHY|nr:adenylyl cyclase-associated family protein [Phanerochaete sordida]
MSSNPGLHSLTTIIKRLEAATSRLEDLAALGAPLPPAAPPAAPSLGSTEPTPVPPPAPHAAARAPPAETPQVVRAYDEAVIDGKLRPFVELTKSFASQSVVTQVGLVEKEYIKLREVILLASRCKKPDDKALEGVLIPLSKDIEAVIHAKEEFRKDRDWNNHHVMLAEGAPAVGWVAVTPKPGPYVKDTKESSEFYGNRVIKEFKDKEPKQVEWVRAWYGLLEELRKYVMEYHTTGLAWNPSGVSVAEYQSAGSSAPAAGGAPPPPPPPPPGPPPPPPVAPAAAAPAAGGVSAVFAELNRGEEVTKGLRKVDKSEMTHKNPALRASGTVPSSVGAGSSAAAPKKPLKPTKPQALAGKKPTKFVMEGNKWLIENYENEPSLVVENTDLSHTVNLYGCKNTTVIVKGKINGVTMFNCTKTSILVENVISSIAITSSPSFTLQITGSSPTIQLDSTDSGHIFLSKDCLGVEITTAKCSSINVNLPVEGEEEGVFSEAPIPEMFKTMIKDGKLVTTAVEHAG